MARRDGPVLERLGGHRLLDKLHGADLLGWADVLGRPVRQAVFRADDFEALREAACAGMGVALLPGWVVGADVQAGRLHRLRLGAEKWNEKCAGIFLLRALAEPPAKLRVFMEGLRRRIGAPPCWEGG